MKRGAATPSPTPIPVEGDVQVFADAACTQYATGEVSEVYVRINRPWGFGGTWNVSGSTEGDQISCFAPDQDNPTDPYLVNVWVDFFTIDRSTPYDAGEVAKASVLSGGAPVDVTNFTKVFTKP